MLGLLKAVRPADRITDYPSPVDVREAMALAGVRANTRLWFDGGGRMVGFAFVDPYHNLRFEFDQQAAGSDLALEIVRWGEVCIRRAMQETGESLTLAASCRDDNTERIALLARHGFIMQAMRSLQMARPLDKRIATPQVPPGFSLGHVAGEHEAAALVALHRAAFGTTMMTVEERLAMMRGPDYDPKLDLLIIAPDGRFAATCMAAIYQEENARTGRKEGYTDPIATHPDFQRRGLAKALLLTGLHKLKQRGMDIAVLGTSSENIAMQRTAQAVGFHVRSTTLWFSKPVAKFVNGTVRRGQ
jgi:ribosomal protein S18 acetylase RimI-like enzyme